MSENNKQPEPQAKKYSTDEWLAAFNEMLSKGKLQAALMHLLNAPTTSSVDPFGEPDALDTFVASVTKIVRQSSSGPAFMALASARMRRKSKKASPLARRIWRNVLTEYAQQEEFPWLDSHAAPLDVRAWIQKRLLGVGHVVATGNAATARDAQTVQRVAALVLGTRTDAEQGLLALIESITPDTQSLGEFVRWATKNLSRPTLSWKSLALFRGLSAPNVQDLKASKIERNQALEQYERAAAQVRHLTSRVAELSSALKAVSAEKDEFANKLASAERACREAENALQVIKQQLHHAVMVEREKIIGEFERKVGHELSEAIFSLDDASPDVQMALDRLRQAKQLLQKP